MAKQKEKQNENEIEEEAPSKEVKAVLNALQAYSEKHNNDVQVVLGLVAYGPEGEIIDDRICLFGHKEGLGIVAKELLAEIKKMPNE